MSIKVPGYMINIPRFASTVVVTGVPSAAVKEKVELIQRQLAKDEAEFAFRRERMLTRELAKPCLSGLCTWRLDEIRGW